MAESSQVKQELRSLGPGNLQASPGDHKHDGTTSKIMNPATAYIPAWTAVTTNPVLNNGQLTGSYSLVGKLVFFKIFLMAGSTTTFGLGDYRLSLPFAALNSVNAAWSTIGTAMLQDTSASLRFVYFPSLVTANGSTIQLISNTGALWGPSAPFIMAVNDVISVEGRYERA